MGQMDGKVAFISGVARGQGRSHALRLAEEGADIIGFDICRQIDSVPYPLASEQDLEETVALVEKLGRRIVGRQADVRDFSAVRACLAEGLEALGHVDIVLANAGAMFGGLGLTEWSTIMEGWADSLDVMLTGVVHTVGAALPAMIARGAGGSIVITSSTAGLKSMAGPVQTAEAAFGGIGYIAAKHGVVGLMKAWAASLANLNIRVNTIHPTGVSTPFLINDYFSRIAEHFPSATEAWKNALPVELIDAEDVSNAIVWLCSDAARYVTGVTLPVDAGFLVR
jgi:SDR family mycofactocin-dependent oxidoreductase